MNAKKTTKPARTAATVPIKFISYPKWSSIYALIVGLIDNPGTLMVSSTSPYWDTINPYIVHEIGHI